MRYGYVIGIQRRHAVKHPAAYILKSDVLFYSAKPSIQSCTGSPEEGFSAALRDHLKTSIDTLEQVENRTNRIKLHPPSISFPRREYSYLIRYLASPATPFRP